VETVLFFSKWFIDTMNFHLQLETLFLGGTILITIIKMDGILLTGKRLKNLWSQTKNKKILKKIWLSLSLL